MYFNYNTQLQDSVIKILKEITEDTMAEQGVVTPHYVIPKILDQRLQSVRQQRPLLYKEFQVGVLNHVYSDHYGFSLSDNNGHACLEYKSKGPNTKIVSVSEKTVFLLYKKGDKIGDRQANRIFYINLKNGPNKRVYYLNMENGPRNQDLNIRCFKLKTLDNLKPDGTIGLESMSEGGEIPTVFLPVESFKSGHGIPIVISIVYEADMSSLSFTAKLVGEEAIAENIKEHPEPMTLDRF
ncbi:hypothetical protein BDF21DRAFT_414090 [Thamnidium elegans]|nr:hypothetical protein BDF21DRAFT_414090 [Thamnidium elegans]